MEMVAVVEEHHVAEFAEHRFRLQRQVHVLSYVGHQFDARDTVVAQRAGNGAFHFAPVALAQVHGIRSQVQCLVAVEAENVALLGSVCTFKFYFTLVFT